VHAGWWSQACALGRCVALRGEMWQWLRGPSLDDLFEELVVPFAVGVKAEDKPLSRHAHQVAR
jgi:hypothetical protein